MDGCFSTCPGPDELCRDSNAIISLSNKSEKARMAEKTAGVSSFNWWLPSRAGFLAFVASVAVAVCQADTALLLYLFFGLILIVFSIALLAYTAFGKDRRKRLTLLSTLAAVWAVAV